MTDIKTSIKIPVIDNLGNTIELEIEYDDDSVTFINAVTDDRLFGLDWSANMKPAILRMLDIFER